MPRTKTGRPKDELPKVIGWQGRFEGNGAYPILNRALTAEMEALGWEVIANEHADPDGDITPYFVSCLYPPRTLPVQHDRTLCVSTWEFDGRGATPQSFLTTFANYDTVWAGCGFAGDVFRADGAENVVNGRLGVDGHEYNPFGDVMEVDAPTERFRLLWVGGTDPRHGFDLALAIAEEVGDSIHLIAKQHPDYPAVPAKMSNLTLIQDDLPTLAPLYRACDALLHPARAVGPSLPVMEALACGLDVISTDHPAVREYGDDLIHFVSASHEPMKHHIHFDSRPQWYEPHMKLFTMEVHKLAEEFNRRALVTPERATAFAEEWSWAAAARSLEAALLEETDA